MDSYSNYNVMFQKKYLNFTNSFKCFLVVNIIPCLKESENNVSEPKKTNKTKQKKTRLAESHILFQKVKCYIN